MHSRCIKCFCEGAKTMLFKGKREAGNAPPATSQRDAAPAASPRPFRLRRTAHVRSDAASAASPRATTHRTHVPHPAHSAPKSLRLLRIACPRPPQAGYARNAGLAPKTKSLRQNSRAARTNPIKSRPAACTSGGINNSPSNEKATHRAAFSFEAILRPFLWRWSACGRVSAPRCCPSARSTS